MDYFSCVSGSIFGPISQCVWVYILWCVHVSVVMVGCVLVYGVSKKESVRALIHGLSVQTLLLVITFKIKL